MTDGQSIILPILASFDIAKDLNLLKGNSTHYLDQYQHFAYGNYGSLNPTYGL